jgi:hypothetical protein
MAASRFAKIFTARELTNQSESRMIYPAATSPSGKARVCKTLTMGSIPIVASEKQRSTENSGRALLRGAT